MSNEHAYIAITYAAEPAQIISQRVGVIGEFIQVYTTAAGTANHMMKLVIGLKPSSAYSTPQMHHAPNSEIVSVRGFSASTAITMTTEKKAKHDLMM